ncbi:MAG: diguanylate cyclase [Azoarcus sp.]|jgi:diguanylate cyclase (GGDEF)-like protein/PAS domain S-box-containing protein|nr:diguanylate cyclase [Azoarcus sp.]
MPFQFVVLLSSLVLAAVFAVGGKYLYSQESSEFELELSASRTTLFNVYALQREALLQHMQVLAYSIATNVDSVNLMSAAVDDMRNSAMRGDNTARVQRLHDMFKTQLAQQWDTLTTQYNVLHMQYLLPDGTTFLRMDAPTNFGDVPLSIRPMLADVIKNHQVRSGFEIGRTYAGTRGIAPIMRTDADGQKNCIGIVEVGIRLDKQLDRLSRFFGSGYAVLLNSSSVTGVMQEKYTPTEKIGDRFLLSSSGPEAAEWLKAGKIIIDEAAPREEAQDFLLNWTDRVSKKEHQYQVITFPLHDYRSRIRPEYPPPGTMLLWRDVTEQVQQLHNARVRSIGTAVVVWLLAQALLLVAFYVPRKEWRAHLRRRAAIIKQLSNRNALLLKATEDGICGVDRDGNISFVNRAALMMTGFGIEELIGKNVHSVLHHHLPHGGGEYAAEYCPLMQTLSDGKARNSEEWYFRRDGSTFPVKVSATSVIENDVITGALIVFHDITEQRNRQEALLQLATTDSLTGASNRRHFFDQLEAELSRQRRHGGLASLLMTDLDFFKLVNDKYGHAAGDAVLSHFVRIVRQTVRRSDVIGRLGGEEFAILLPGDGTSGGRELAERLRRTFEENPTTIGGRTIPCTVSIGISDLRTDDMTADKPLLRADIALYSAKEAGRNCTVLFDPSSTDSTAVNQAIRQSEWKSDPATASTPPAASTLLNSVKPS